MSSDPPLPDVRQAHRRSVGTPSWLTAPRSGRCLASQARTRQSWQAMPSSRPPRRLAPVRCEVARPRERIPLRATPARPPRRAPYQRQPWLPRLRLPSSPAPCGACETAVLAPMRQCGCPRCSVRDGRPAARTREQRWEARRAASRFGIWPPARCRWRRMRSTPAVWALVRGSRRRSAGLAGNSPLIRPGHPLGPLAWGSVKGFRWRSLRWEARHRFEVRCRPSWRARCGRFGPTRSTRLASMPQGLVPVRSRGSAALRLGVSSVVPLSPVSVRHPVIALAATMLSRPLRGRRSRGRSTSRDHSGRIALPSSGSRP